MTRWKGVVFLWAVMVFSPALSSHLVRERRIVNELGDVQPRSNGVLPSNKRQQIIYLLNNNTPSKRDQQPANMTRMEKYAKELTVDGRVVSSQNKKYLVSEEFHGRGFKEVAVNKGDGPPKLTNDQRQQTKASNVRPVVNITTDSNKTISPKREQITIPAHSAVPLQSGKAFLNNTQMPNTKNLATDEHAQTIIGSDSQNVQKSAISVAAGRNQQTINQQGSHQQASASRQLTKQSANEGLSEERSSNSRVKNRNIKRMGILQDGEILPPSKLIDPNVFSIPESAIRDTTGRGYTDDEINSDPSEHGTVLLPGDGMSERWRPPRRRFHHHYHRRHRVRPVILNNRPDIYYMPMYSGRSDLQMLPFTPGEGVFQGPPRTAENDMQYFPTAGYRREVLLQPLVQVPVMAPQQGLPFLPSQPIIQAPYPQQTDARSAMLTLPIAAVPQQPQPLQLVYPMATVPTVQQDPLRQQVQMPQEYQPIEQELQQQQNREREQLQRQRDQEQQELEQEQLQESRPLLATHWVDEPGRARSEVNNEDIPAPQRIDEDRLGDSRDSYIGNNGARYYDDSDAMDSDERYNDFRRNDDDYGRYSDFRSSYEDDVRDNGDRADEQELPPMERGEEYRQEPAQTEEEGPYGEENASIRSNAADILPKEDEENDDNDEDESEESQRALQDSRDDTPEVEENETPLHEERQQEVSHAGVERNNPEAVHSFSDEERVPSVIRIPSNPQPMVPLSRYHRPFSADTFDREQLLGQSSPLAEKVLPRLMDSSKRRTPIVSPNADIIEMSDSEARFRERMNMEMQASSFPILASKDTIPKSFHTSGSDGLKNVIIRLNGKPLENASELRSRIVYGRVVRGKGKVIKSKGPMKIRVTHTKGRRKMKIIDIIAPQQYHVSDARSSIGRLGTTKLSTEKQKDMMKKRGKAAMSATRLGSARRNKSKTAKIYNIDRVAAMIAAHLLQKKGNVKHGTFDTLVRKSPE